ncbi:MAG: C-GCAxxG-C-C family protein [Clostridia bacterium]|nr:C-GCAxxG-C-C family protein [Clostridia bacterium]
MSISRAKNYYLGQNGSNRMNCAQAVICAFKENFNLKDELIELFRAYGGGNAPDGLCGAFFAAKYILENNKSDDYIELEKFFIEHAGSLKCRDIKGLRKLSCVGCVEKSAEFLGKLG